MTEAAFSMTHRTDRLIGRDDEMEEIAEHLFSPGDECRIIAIKGRGGIGKTRLLEEVLNCSTKSDDKSDGKFDCRKKWGGDPSSITVSEIIDFDDIRISVRSHLLSALRSALIYSETSGREKENKIDFTSFDRAADEFQLALTRSASAADIQNAIERAEDAFWKDYARHAEKTRIVLLLDTAERLVHHASEWLQEQGLLTEFETIQEILDTTTPQWLIRQIEKNRFRNTTLLIAGRDADDEGGLFFQQLKEIAEKSSTCKYYSLDLDVFTIEESTKYIRSLAERFKQKERADTTTSVFLKSLAEDKPRIELLHRYTEGLPVLLSIYIDILHEADDLPDALKLSFPDNINSRDDDETVDIEEQFIRIITWPDDRSRILRSIARCPAGLDEDQLHFLLSEQKTVEAFIEWRKTFPESEPLIQEIEKELKQLSDLTILKKRADNRLGLQDEVYRIYDKGMLAYDKRKKQESDERKAQYKKLQDWAEYQLQKSQTERRDYLTEDERKLEIGGPTRALTPRFPYIDPVEHERRSKIQQDILKWEMERLHYALLRDPANGFNDAYTDLAESRWQSFDLEADVMAQIAAWRVLKNDAVFQFMGTEKDVKEALLRFAAQDDVTRWMKRLIVREAYQEVLAFRDEVEKRVDKIADDKIRWSWKHTLAKGEREVWAGYAKIMLGDDIDSVFPTIQKYLEKLQKLAQATTKDKIVENEEGYLETGFKAGDITEEDHPALPRLYRVLAIGYNYIGYGYVTLGRYQEGVTNYVKALYYMRNTQFRSQETVTRNNLGRALAALGREERGYRICADALNLRRQMGQIIPIAYSLNTLALINNGMQRPKRAWHQAARAAAYFRQAQNERGLGLSLIQLSIALRRLAMQIEPGEVLSDDPRQIFGVANEAIREAVRIFSPEEDEHTNEPLRLAEAYIELGCVIRDQITLPDTSSQHRKRYAAEARIALEKAIEIAQKHGFKQIELEAKVDRAWTYYYANDFSQVREHLDNILNSNLIDQDYRLGESPNTLPQKEDKPYLYYEQGKIHLLYMLIAFQEFENQMSERKQGQSKSGEDAFYKKVLRYENIQMLLQTCADEAVQSLLYAQLFSPRSRLLVLTYNQIYNHLKRFNIHELTTFHRKLGKVRKKYPSLDAIKLRSYDFSDLGAWLTDNFGTGMFSMDEA